MTEASGRTIRKSAFTPVPRRGCDFLLQAAQKQIAHGV